MSQTAFAQTPSPVDASNSAQQQWKSYRSDSLGISFEYPSMWTNLQIVPKANDENSTRPNILIQGPYRHLGALSILALPSSIFNVSSIGEMAKKRIR